MTLSHRALPCLISVSVLVLILALVYLLVFDPLVDRYAEQSRDLERQANQIAGYQRLVDSKPELLAALKASAEAPGDNTLYFTEASEALAASALQKRVKDLVEFNSGKLLSTQKLTTRSDDPFPPVSVRVHMSGRTDAIARTLHALESQRPLLFVDEIQVQSRQRRKTRREGRKRIVETITDLTATFNITGYMQARPGNAG